MHRTGNATTTELFFDVLVVRDCIQPTHGVLAPNAKLRREIVPSPPEQATAPACDHAQGAPARLSWARLLKRVFDIDIEHCPNCGGSLNIAHSHNRRIELNDATDKSHRIASVGESQFKSWHRRMVFSIT